MYLILRHTGPELHTHRRDARLEVRMLYVARLHNDDDEQERRRRDNYSSLLSLHNGTGTRVRAHDEARLEAGWVQCMRHASASSHVICGKAYGTVYRRHTGPELDTGLGGLPPSADAIRDIECSIDDLSHDHCAQAAAKCSTHGQRSTHNGGVGACDKL